jgi:hypothetical protein
VCQIEDGVIGWDTYVGFYKKAVSFISFSVTGVPLGATAEWPLLE